MRLIIDIIKNILDSIRDTNQIYGIVPKAIDYTGTLDFDYDMSGIFDGLMVGDYIKLDAGSITKEGFKVVELSGMYCKIKKADGDYVNESSKNWTKTKPVFLIGDDLEIIQKLKEYDESISYKNQKFPLIAMTYYNQEPVYEGRIDSKSNVTLLICTNTDPNYSTDERETLIYKTILYPLRDKIVNEIIKNRYYFLRLPVNRTLDYKQQNLYFMKGKKSQILKGQNTDQLAINFFVDAIELTFNFETLKYQ